MTRAFLTLSAIALLIPGISSCRRGDVAHQDEAITVRVHTVSQEQAGDQYAYPGAVEGDRKITVSTKVMGTVLSLPLREGARVRAGQIVARIKSDDIAAKRAQVQANREEASAALKNVEANYQRVKSLYERKSATKKELDDITAAYEMTQAKLRAIDEMEKEVVDVLRYADIVSPIDGVITGRFTEEGNLASPGMPILSIESLGKLKVSMKVPESELAVFTVGTAVTVDVDAARGAGRLPGVVSEVNGASNQESHDVNVKITLRAAGADVRPGMYATVYAAGPARATVSVPESLLVRRGQLDGLYTLSPAGEAMLRWVRTGKTLANGRVEILSGLAAGESVIVGSDKPLVDGARVGVAQ